MSDSIPRRSNETMAQQIKNRHDAGLNRFASAARESIASIDRFRRPFFVAVFLLSALSAQVVAEQAGDLESVDAATRAMWLVDGLVLDADTLAPIQSFTVTPGTLSTDDENRTTVRWRDNLKREMKEGRFQWPRTSGFSVMRFRVTAPGHQPGVTQRIWRGGPHTRIRVKLVPLTVATSVE